MHQATILRTSGDIGSFPELEFPTETYRGTVDQ